jgi:PAS domain S-box-containing protein
MESKLYIDSHRENRRKKVRRNGDILVKNRMYKDKKIFKIGKIMISELDFDRLFQLIIHQTKQIMDVERCSIFLIDEKKEMLNAFVSAGMDQVRVQVDKNRGIVGWVYHTGESAIVNDAYEDSRFYPDIDRRMGFQTKNILCVPLRNKRNHSMGALEVVNKYKGGFSEEDCELLTNLSYYVSISLENATLVDHMKTKTLALQKSEEKYRSMIESIIDGYFEVDLAGNLHFFNDPMIHILGYSKEEMLGMNNRVYMTETTSQMVYQTFHHVYLTGEPAKAFGWELIRKDGQVRYVETSVSLIKDPAGNAVGFRGIARDITELKSFEKARERVVNHLSHELGTPIAIVDAAIEMIPKVLESEEESKVAKMCKRVSRNVNRLKELRDIIDDIINERSYKPQDNMLPLIESALSILEIKNSPNKNMDHPLIIQDLMDFLDHIVQENNIHMEMISLDSLLFEVIKEAYSLMKSREIEIIHDFEPELWLHMDRNVFRKVCRGLLRNAIENTPDEGSIEVRTTQGPQMARIEFVDSGVGITPQNQKMIFSGFFHTQDTVRYSSKEPYSFNAGGWGADLLRTKVLSERFGFFIHFSSKRCGHLALDSDECPGRISSCTFLRSKDECNRSGGSSFCLSFPLEHFGVQ